MRKKSETLKKYSPILLTAGISCALFCLLLWMREFYPFGGRSVMFTDMYDECVPSLYRFYDIITGHKNIFYEFQASGGINLYTETINEICNPFNYSLLFWKRENIYLAVNVLLLMYVTAAACSAHFFLIKVWDKPSKRNSLLSLCYAFSGYFAYNFQILRWMILPVLFPLFLLSGIRLLKEHKGGMYAFLLGYQIILSVQHGFMTLLFCLFTSGIWLYCMEDKKARKDLCFYVAVYTVIGLLLSAIVLLPTIDTLFASSRSGANVSYFKVFAEHGLRDLFERLFQFCHPVLTGLLFFYLYKNLKKYGWKGLLSNETIRFTFLWNIFLWLTVLIQPANLLWHMGSYVCFPVRYGYMLLIAFVCLIKVMENHLAEAERGSFEFSMGKLLSGAGAVILLVMAVKLFKNHESYIVAGFLTLAISSAYTKEAVIVVIMLMLILGAVLLASAGKRLSLPLLFLTAAVSGYCYFYMVSIPANFGEHPELSYEIMTEQYEESEKSNLGDLIRRQKHNTALPRNAALINGESSLSGYFPTVDAKVQSTMGKLGYLTSWVSTIDIGGTEISDYFFNHTFFVKEESADFAFADNLPLENQQILLEAMLSDAVTPQEISSIFEIVSGDLMPVSESGNLTLDLEDTATIYLDAAVAANQLQIIVNEERVNPPMLQMQDNPHVLLCLGTFPEGEVRISLKDTAGEPCSPEQIKLGIFKENEWNAALEKTNTLFSADEIYVNSKGIHCSLSVSDYFEEGVLILPLNAVKGWEAAIDKTTADIYRIGDCFLGIMITEGAHELELTYYPPFLKIGVILSLIGTALAVFFCAFRNSNACQMVLQTAPLTEKLFLLIFWGALAVIYVIPTFGLAVSIIRRFMK